MTHPATRAVVDPPAFRDQLLDKGLLTRQQMAAALDHARRANGRVANAVIELGLVNAVLELGADDYLVKPFEPQVLTARVGAMFRRLKAAA